MRVKKIIVETKIKKHVKLNRKLSKDFNIRKLYLYHKMFKESEKEKVSSLAQ